MALFNKKQDDRNVNIPPMPPAAPVQPVKAPVGNIAPPAPELNNLSAPPAPGGNLADIKAQVGNASQNNNSMPPASAPIQVESSSDVKQPVSTQEAVDEDDSLFDFSELEIETPIENKHSNNSQKQIQNEKSTNREVNFEEDSDLSFINRKSRNKVVSETYFVTTKQFKSLLEIVESVKLKVKNSAETHLKLLDIKAEEDIEFENLRKDFQFIEDKLYEVDNIIFEK